MPSNYSALCICQWFFFYTAFTGELLAAILTMVRDLGEDTMQPLDLSVLVELNYETTQLFALTVCLVKAISLSL